MLPCSSTQVHTRLLQNELDLRDQQTFPLQTSGRMGRHAGLEALCPELCFGPPRGSFPK